MESLATVTEERNVLQQHLKEANELVRQMRDVLTKLAGPGASRSQAPWSGESIFARLMATPAYGQSSPPPQGSTRTEKAEIKQLQDLLKKYDSNKQELTKKLESIQRKQQEQQPPAPESGQQRLLKSW